jgi:tripeptidyl-peptidase-1
VARQYQNIDSLESKLASVSTPGNADYGKYLDLEDLNAIFAPSETAESKVKAWLEKSGAANVVSDGSLVTFTTTVGNANQMLSTKFDLYTNGETTHLRTTAYSIPDDLGDAIDLISPTTYFGNMKAHRAVPNTPPSKTEQNADVKRQLKPACETTVSVPISANQTEEFDLLSPTCLKELYNIGNYKVDPSAGSTIAFGSFLNQSASFSDLAKFEKIFDIPSQKLKILALINGGVNNQDPVSEQDGEANLDAQNMIGLVDGLPVGEYITGGSPPFIPDLLSPNQSSNTNEPYLQYYQYLLSQPNKNLPYVRQLNITLI